MIGRALLFAVLAAVAASPQTPIVVDYPLEGSMFPPGFAPPTFLWRDPGDAGRWSIDISFADGAAALHAESTGGPMPLGNIDPRCIGPTNQPPQPPPGHAWKPDPALWRAIQSHPSATITFTGQHSQGHVTIHTSADPLTAPIFFRDVPLMPSELKKGEIKPISPRLLPVVRWSVRDVREPASRVVMEGIHTCANCHSFSADGKTLAMDLDGPHNDKGLYAIVPVQEQSSIASRDVISWRAFRNQTRHADRVGFMSQLSPDGRYVVTATEVEYYVANFKDYRFLQVFYPTRGILAFYDRSDGRMRPLPGADDPRYVQANAVWSPDGSSLVFARAIAGPSYPEGRRPAEYANDPNEPPVRYDLYRIPFNAGRGGKPVPVAGASQNGMSNSFPKVSPDGRWLVYVQSRNGQLMRPDGQLYIVPAAGGSARRMKCNTPLMNSWHSFSPDGRWMVFSSKSRSPYTQMFLTHIDEQGNDTPAILIENATDANRAVNLPEFVNLAPGALTRIDAPAAEFYRLYDVAWDLTEKGDVTQALEAWTRALALDPADPRARTNYAALLLQQGKVDDAAERLRAIVATRPDVADASVNLGIALQHQGKLNEAIVQLRAALDIDPDNIEAYANLGNALAASGRHADAARAWKAALTLDPNRPQALANFAWLLATCPDPRIRNAAEAVRLAERATALTHRQDPWTLGILGAAYAESARFAEAIQVTRHALLLAADRNDQPLAATLVVRLTSFESAKPWREPR